ncbi:hypothetical protein J3459_013666 [Metarhizium acridum]|nr:hypothetical protein J3459_013666 [Metarhizium acridum]
MINAMLWTTLVLPAAVYGLPQQNAPNVPNTGGFDFNAIIRNTPEVQAHMASTTKGLLKILPYSEGLLKDSLLKDPKAKDILKKLPESDLKCLFVRNSMQEDGSTSTLDINALANVDVVTGDKEQPFHVSKSTARTDSQRLGWNKESSDEVGASVTGELSAGFLTWSASLSTTVYGNMRTTSGTNGEASTQNDYETTVDVTLTCPPKSICRYVTWTYMRTIRGTCTLTPYYKAQCANEKNRNLYSLGLMTHCSPAEEIAQKFYSFTTYIKELSGYGPELQGIKMPKPDIALPKYEQKCSFSYALRYGDGRPVSASANIIEKSPDPNAKKIKVASIPKAIRWRTTKAGDRVCMLQRGWSWMPPNDYYVPKEEGGNGEWVNRGDWPEPEDRKIKCPDLMTPSSNISQRAEEEEEEPPRRDARDDAPVDDDAFFEEPPHNDRVKVVIIQDGLPGFEGVLSQSPSEGFVADRIDTGESSKRALAPREDGSMAGCFNDLIQRLGP